MSQSESGLNDQNLDMSSDQKCPFWLAFQLTFSQVLSCVQCRTMALRINSL
jgi:hypothetical protein